jgi:hypothetical protein
MDEEAATMSHANGGVRNTCPFIVSNNTDVNGPKVLKDHPSSELCNISLAKCCSICTTDKDCTSFVLAAPSSWSVCLHQPYCFLLSGFSSTKGKANSHVGTRHPPAPTPAPGPTPPPTPKPNCVLFGDNGQHNMQQTWSGQVSSIFGCPRRGCVGSPLQFHAAVYSIQKGGRTAPIFLGSSDHAAVPFRFPDPSAVPGVFALRDSPRFVPPEWGATPAPTTVDPALRNRSGYDARNDADDVYLFIPPLTATEPPARSSSADMKHAYSALRSDVLALTGEVPRLPDWAFGTWFTGE